MLQFMGGVIFVKVLLNILDTASNGLLAKQVIILNGTFMFVTLWIFGSP
jgi:hypothetical protein